MDKHLRYTNQSTSLVIKEMSNHSKMPPHTTNMAKKADNKKHWQRCGTGTLIHCWLEHKIMQLLWKFVSSSKTKHGITIQPSNSTPKYIPKN